MSKLLSESVRVRAFPDGVAISSGEQQSQVDYTKNDETYTEGGVRDEIIPVSAADQDIDFGGVTNAKRVVLEILEGGALTVKVTGGATPNAIPLNKIMVLSGNDTQTITAISVSNPSATVPVNLRIGIWG